MARQNAQKTREMRESFQSCRGTAAKDPRQLFHAKLKERPLKKPNLQYLKKFCQELIASTHLTLRSELITGKIQGMPILNFDLVGMVPSTRNDDPDVLMPRYLYIGCHYEHFNHYRRIFPIDYDTKASTDYLRQTSNVLDHGNMITQRSFVIATAIALFSGQLLRDTKESPSPILIPHSEGIFTGTAYFEPDEKKAAGYEGLDTFFRRHPKQRQQPVKLHSFDINAVINITGFKEINNCSRAEIEIYSQLLPFLYEKKSKAIEAFWTAFLNFQPGAEKLFMTEAAPFLDTLDHIMQSDSWAQMTEERIKREKAQRKQTGKPEESKPYPDNS